MAKPRKTRKKRVPTVRKSTIAAEGKEIKAAARKAVKSTIKKAKKARAPKKVRKPKKATKAPRTPQLSFSASAEMRRYAGLDYITDPEGRSVDWHWGRDDRDYKKSVALVTFKRWGVGDKWVNRREEFWAEIEARTLDGLQDAILRQRLVELTAMTKARSYMSEYMMPLTDEAGEVRRYPMRDENGEPHPYAGLPQYALDLPKFDKMLKAILDLDERVMLKRGEAITRTENIGGTRSKVTTTTIDPVGSLMNITPEEARHMAKQLLRQRMGERYDGLLVEDIENENEGSLASDYGCYFSCYNSWVSLFPRKGERR